MWLKRFFLAQNKFLRFTPLVSIFSLILASSCLVLAMSVYSGYESTVKQSITDMTGHLVIMAKSLEKEQYIFDKIQAQKTQIKSYAPFLSLKSLLIYEGKLSGVSLEGVSVEKVGQTLKKRLITGEVKLQGPKSALIGRGVASKFKLKPGDFFHIVFPKFNKEGSFQKKHQSLYVEGVLDFGFHNFNSRHILVNIKTAQNLIQGEGLVSGLRLLLKNPKGIDRVRAQLQDELGSSYRVNDWQGIIKNLHQSYLDSVRREKFLIFFILMVLVLAGAFNVSSHLSISIVNQIRELSILKVMGARENFIFSLLLAQGFIISFVGTSFGIGLGWLLSKSFVVLQKIWSIIPAEVYKINTIVTDLRLSDMFLIFICSQLICLLSCIWPAWRALKLSVREGLSFQ